jgi:hypothetical protein
MKDIVDQELITELLNQNVKFIEEVRSRYHFQGDTNYRDVFDSLLLFYDKALFDTLGLKQSELKRLINAYFWYTKYIGVLRHQGIPTSDHEQAKFKIIEEIDGLDERSDWTFIKEIDDLAQGS